MILLLKSISKDKNKMTLQKNSTKKSVNTVKNVNTDVQSSLTLDKIKNALAQVNGCLENINRIKTIILRLNSAHKNHKMWIKITSLLMRKELDKSAVVPVDSEDYWGTLDETRGSRRNEVRQIRERL